MKGFVLFIFACMITTAFIGGEAVAQTRHYEDAFVCAARCGKWASSSIPTVDYCDRDNEYRYVEGGYLRIISVTTTGSTALEAFNKLAENCDGHIFRNLERRGMRCTLANAPTVIEACIENRIRR